nr:patatin-like phospholipase family protein [uncultured Albidiferax sp.]
MTTPREPPEDRFCDLVMKGGITSGVVYPKAIEQLSHHYRFKNIGGTSAGAIAAAVTAAAEFNRRTNQSRDGFDLLAQLPTELKSEVKPGRRKLLTLFQPQPGTRRLFSILTTALNSQGTAHRILAITFGALRAYWMATLGSVAVSVFVGFADGDILAAALTFLVMLAVSIALSVYWDLTRHIVKNNFGLCTGLTEDSTQVALTPWLHQLIQRAAGRSENDAPLTFGDLWSAPGFPVGRFTVPAGTVRKSINLEMFSTNLGHGRPYIFPLSNDEAEKSRFRVKDRLFFTRNDMAHYLPTDVLDWLCAKGRPYRCDSGREGRDPSNEDAVRLGLIEIPEGKDFPVILAARMSLSFPVLFSAVPMWAINYEQGGLASFRRCWFSDGGISSNFPIHLFDGLVPSWPTFGINLEQQIEGREDVYLPASYASGYGERWNNFDATTNEASRFGGFLLAIVSTMQNWNDNALSRMPGVRDRIARVRLSAKEGGLNLNMESEVIEGVARRGEKAALQIIERFAALSPDGPNKKGWDEQRWIRLGLLLKLIEERAPGVLTALDPECPHATGFAYLIERTAFPNTELPPGYEQPMSSEQQEALRSMLAALGKLVGTVSEPRCTTSFKAIPKSELRVRPPL